MQLVDSFLRVQPAQRRQPQKNQTLVISPRHVRASISLETYQRTISLSNIHPPFSSHSRSAIKLSINFECSPFSPVEQSAFLPHELDQTNPLFTLQP